MSDERSTARFQYFRSPLYRTVHADGAFGGMTPSGKINIGFFSDRAPFPEFTELEVRENTIGELVQSRMEAEVDGVREIEVNVILDLGSARALRAWLDDKIEKLEAATSPGGAR